jgi:hypothetical protein
MCYDQNALQTSKQKIRLFTILNQQENGNWAKNIKPFSAAVRRQKNQELKYDSIKVPSALWQQTNKLYPCLTQNLIQIH